MKTLKLWKKFTFVLCIRDRDRLKLPTEGVKLLCRCWLPELSHLTLWWAEISQSGAKILMRAHWPKLVHLDIGTRLMTKVAATSVIRESAVSAKHTYLS